MTQQHSRSRRLAPWLPWTDGSGRPWPGWARLPLAIPFVLVYLVAAWALFLPAAERRGRHYWIDEDAVGHLLYHIPELTSDPYRAVRSLITAPWLNHDSLQLVYVTILLVLFGAAFELHEGTGHMMLIFFGTSFAAALVAGILLHMVYPEVWNTRFLENAWNRSWTGGSAGCFGVMGALAARARSPGPLLVLFIAWECFIWWVNLRNYTSVFHLTALTTGFVVARHLMPEPTAGRA